MKLLFKYNKKMYNILKGGTDIKEQKSSEVLGNVLYDYSNEPKLIKKLIITFHDNYVQSCINTRYTDSCLSRTQFKEYYKMVRKKGAHKKTCHYDDEFIHEGNANKTPPYFENLFRLITYLFNIRCSRGITTIMPRTIKYDKLLYNEDLFNNIIENADSMKYEYVKDDDDINNLFKLMYATGRLLNTIVENNIVNHIFIYFLIGRLDTYDMQDEKEKNKRYKKIQDIVGDDMYYRYRPPEQPYNYAKVNINDDGNVYSFFNCCETALFFLFEKSGKIKNIRINGRSIEEKDYYENKKYSPEKWSRYLKDIPKKHIFNKGSYEIKALFISQVAQYLLNNNIEISDEPHTIDNAKERLFEIFDNMKSEYKIELMDGHVEVKKKGNIYIIYNSTIYNNLLFHLLNLKKDVINNHKFVLISGNSGDEIKKQIERMDDGYWGILHSCGNYIDNKLVLDCKDTNKLVILRGCFMNNQNITQLIIGNNVIIIGDYAFTSCSNLTGDINIPDSVENIGVYAFSQTKITGNIKIPDSVENIGVRAFYQTKIIRLFIGSHVTNIGDYAFGECKELTGDIKIPDSVKNIGNGAFYKTKIIRLTIGAGVTYIGDSAFYECNELTGDIKIPDSVENIGGSAFCQTKITGLTIGASVTYIGDGAFSECKELTGDIKIPDSVENIDNGAFYQTKITGLTIGSLVTNIGDYAFGACEYLSGDIKIPDNVENIGVRAFYKTKITGLTIGSHVTNIGDYAFSRCRNLTGDIKIPDSVKNIGEYAFYKTKIIRLFIGIRVTNIGNSKFSRHIRLTGDIKIP